MFHILPRSVLREVWFMGPKAELSDLREDKNPTSRCWEWFKKKVLIFCVKLEKDILTAVLIQVVWSDDVLFGK